MKIIHTTTYTVERVTVKEVHDKDYPYIMEIGARPTWSRAWLAQLQSDMPAYIVLSESTRCELLEDK